MRMSADSILGRILIGSAIALVSALLGLFVGWATAKNAPPQVIIVPDKIETKALEPVEFSASASRDPDSDDLRYKWSIGGVAFDASPVAYCEQKLDPTLAVCRFVMPGTYAVSVEVTDAHGLSSTVSAPITVELSGGYIGIAPFYRKAEADRDAIANALLFAVDWAGVQALVPKPILLTSPDQPGDVLYAATIKRDLFRASEYVKKLGEPTLEMIAIGLGKGAPDLITSQALEAGLNIVWIALPGGGPLAMLPGPIADGGAVPISSPKELASIIRSIADH